MKHQVLENPVKNQISNPMLLVVISGLLITTYLTANIMAVKLITIWGVALFDAGTVTFPLAYMLGDVLTEVWGFRTAKTRDLVSFFCNLLLVCTTAIGLVLPAPDYMAETSDAYATIFTYVPRIVAASLIAFLSGELSNAWVMERLKKATGGRHLWIRTIGSSMLGYVFDTVLFVLIAFAGTAPARDLLTMIAAQYGMKLLLEALGGTPLAYLAVHILKKKQAAGMEETQDA